MAIDGLAMYCLGFSGVVTQHMVFDATNNPGGYWEEVKFANSPVYAMKVKWEKDLGTAGDNTALNGILLGYTKYSTMILKCLNGSK